MKSTHLPTHPIPSQLFGWEGSIVGGGWEGWMFFYNNLKLMEEGQHIELNYKEIDSLER